MAGDALNTTGRPSVSAPSKGIRSGTFKIEYTVRLSSCEMVRSTTSRTVPTGRTNQRPSWRTAVNCEPGSAPINGNASTEKYVNELATPQVTGYWNCGS